MSARTTAIQWTDRTVNPFRATNLETGAEGHWCEKVSDGCKHCYASEWNARVRPLASGIKLGTGLRFELQNKMLVSPYFDREKLLPVIRRQQPTLYFWADMTDMFGEWIDDQERDEVIAVALLTPWHGHQMVTKRIGIARDYFNSPTLEMRVRAAAERLATETASCCATDPRDVVWPLRNLWLLTSVEHQRAADERIPLLRTTRNVAVRGLSIEPMIGPVNLSRYLLRTAVPGRCVNIDGEWWHDPGDPRCGLCLPGIDWVIVGGESAQGGKARPFDIAWLADVVRQTARDGVPLFVKQLGSLPVASGPLDVPSGMRVTGVSGGTEIVLADRKGGDMSEWPEPFRVRQFPRVWAPR